MTNPKPRVRVGLPTIIDVTLYDDDIQNLLKQVGDTARRLLPKSRKDFRGYYHIIAKHSGKCLDVQDESKEDGANAFQYSLHGGPNQQWVFVKADDDCYYIVARHSGKCLDVLDWHKEDGARVCQITLFGGDNQKWQLRQTKDDYFHIIAKHSGKCLDVAGRGTEDGTIVQQYTVHGGDNQKWELRAVKK